MKRIGLAIAGLLACASISGSAQAARYLTFDLTTVGDYPDTSPFASWNNSIRRITTLSFTYDTADLGMIIFIPKADMYFSGTLLGFRDGESPFASIDGMFTAGVTIAPFDFTPAEFTVVPTVISSSAMGSYIYSKYSLVGTFVADVRSLTISGSNSGSVGFTISSVEATVPEPATWAMMVGGFGLVGTGLRRRRMAVGFA